MRTGTLLVPCACTATGQRSFAVNGPATWNRLRPALRSLDLSESAFKRALKTHLFSTARRHWYVFMILAQVINIQTYLLTESPTAGWCHLACLRHNPRATAHLFRKLHDDRCNGFHWQIWLHVTNTDDHKQYLSDWCRDDWRGKYSDMLTLEWVSELVRRA